MSFNFDDDNPFKDLTKILELLQKQFFDQLQDQGINPEDLAKELMNNPALQSFGFSISMGPDGQPDIRRLDTKTEATLKQTNGFEEPFVDIFYSEATKSYQIIAEVPGVETLDLVHVRFEDNNLKLQAETGPYKYRLHRVLEHPVYPDTMKVSLTNGVLEIWVQIK